MEKSQISGASGAKSGALPGDLALIVDSWPGMPADSKAAILKICRD
jgi:hypothetical protein